MTDIKEYIWVPSISICYILSLLFFKDTWSQMISCELSLCLIYSMLLKWKSVKLKSCNSTITLLYVHHYTSSRSLLKHFLQKRTMFERHPIVAAAVATALQIVMNSFMNSYFFFKHHHYLEICYLIFKNLVHKRFINNKHT